MRITIILFTLVFLSSCQDKEIKSTNKNLSISIDTLNISIDSTFMQNYQHTSFNKNNNKLYGYNPSLHRIDYLSIDDMGKNNGFIQLQKEGADGVKAPNDIYVKNNDEIFLITYFHIIKINSEGKIVAKNKINSASTEDTYKSHYLYPAQDSGFDYTMNGNFYILNANMQYSKRKDPKEYYESYKLLSHYNFNEDTLRLLNINFPKMFQEKDFGFNNLAFINVDDDNIYYSFSPLPNLYKYNISTEEIVNYNISVENLPYYKSDYKDISSENYGMNLKSFSKNSNFGPIISSNNFITRVYLSSTPEHKSQKECVLQIFDKNLQFLKNLPINSALGFAGNFSYGKDFFYQINAVDENEIRFLKLKVSLNEK